MKKSVTGAVLAAATLFAMGPTAVAEETPGTPGESSEVEPLTRVSAYAQPSVVYLDITWTGYVYDRFNKMYLNNAEPFELTFQCTGYVVNPDGYIATAGHCVDPAEVTPHFVQAAAEWALANGYYASPDLSLEQVIGFGDYVVRNEKGARGADRVVTAAWSQSAGGVETGKALPARVIKWQKFDAGDGAMLKVEATNLNALPLSDDEVGIGTEIVSIGYPGSVDLVADKTFTPSYKEGAVSSKKTVSNGLLSVYEISAAVSGGMSGGPTVNLEGEVVGFNSFGINSDIETQQFNFVRPVQTVRELLADAGATAELGEDSENYREGLDAFFAGDKETAVAKLEAVVDSQPTHELAQDYLDKAEALPDPPKKEKDNDGGSGLLVLGIAGGALLLVLGGLGLVLGLSRRRRRGTPEPVQQVPTQQVPTQHVPAQHVPTQHVPAQQVPPAGFAPPAPPAGTGATQTGSTLLAPVAAPALQDEPVFCGSCGSRGEAGQRFCVHCGAGL